MWNFPLNQVSYKLYAIAHYRNGNGTWNDFFLDMKLMQSVFRLVSADNKQKHINTILNYIIRLGNVFQSDSLGRLLLILSPVEHRMDIKTFLVFLSRLPDSIPEFNIDEIPINHELAKKLQSL